jgi:hypothetical protein
MAVPNSAYATAGYVGALAAAKLLDPAQSVFVTPYPLPAAQPTSVQVNLIPYMAEGYRKIQSALAAAGSPTFNTDNYQCVISAYTGTDPGAEVSLLFTSTPPNNLPPDMVAPLKLWERMNGSQDDFVEMEDATDSGGLPSVQQGSALQYWEWRGDGIYFIGANQDNQIRIRYQRALADITDATSPIMILRAQNALASWTAASAAAARGAPGAQAYASEFDDSLEDLVSAATRREQRVTRRRRPYASRGGYGPLI